MALRTCQFVNDVYGVNRIEALLLAAYDEAVWTAWNFAGHSPMQQSSRLDDPTWYPQTVDSLETNEVADGYIVYQSDRDRVHYLNHTAAILLALCNGRSAVTELAELLREAFDLSVPPVAEVRDCLEQLVTEGLIT